MNYANPRTLRVLDAVRAYVLTMKMSRQLLPMMILLVCASISASADEISDALLAGRTQEALELIAAGANVSEADDVGATPLFWASGIGSAEVVEALLESGAPINVEMVYAGTPLHAAVVGGHIGVVQLLLDHGANIDAVGLTGTPLRAAVMATSKEMVELLLKEGADVNAVDPDAPRLARSTALDAAIFQDAQEIIDLLEEYGARRGSELP